MACRATAARSGRASVRSTAGACTNGDELAALVAPGDIVMSTADEAASTTRLRACGAKVVCSVTSARTCRTSSRARPGGSSSRTCSRPTPTCSRAQPSSGMSSTRRVAPSSRRRSTASRRQDEDLLPARVERILVSNGLRLGRHELSERPAVLLEERPLGMHDRVVLQVSRWDSLKDPIGVIEGFAEYVAPHTDAHLIYAGPDVTAVADDPRAPRSTRTPASAGGGCPRPPAGRSTSRCCRWSTRE